MTMDPGIQTLVATLNERGIRTFQSCSGHEGSESHPSGHVWLEPDALSIKGAEELSQRTGIEQVALLFGRAVVPVWEVQFAGETLPGFQAAQDAILSLVHQPPVSERCGEKGVDTNFPLSETLKLLVEWVQHLHVWHECDCDGWEQRSFLIEAAQRYQREVTSAGVSTCKWVQDGSDYCWYKTACRRETDSFDGGYCTYCGRVIEIDGKTLESSLNTGAAKQPLPSEFTCIDPDVDREAIVHLNLCHACREGVATTGTGTGEGRAITFPTLISVLERLRSKNKNPNREWYNGWNAAIDCLIRDAKAAATPPAAAEGELNFWCPACQVAVKASYDDESETLMCPTCTHVYPVPPGFNIPTAATAGETAHRRDCGMPDCFICYGGKS